MGLEVLSWRVMLRRRFGSESFERSELRLATLGGGEMTLERLLWREAVSVSMDGRLRGAEAGGDDALSRTCCEAGAAEEAGGSPPESVV
jgi:hypothetical protein